MLCGALGAYAANAASGNPWIGALGGALAGGALALVHAYFVLNRRSNQLATGLIVLFLALGITSLFGAAYVDEVITPFKIWEVPLLSSIPWIGDIFFKADPLTYISYLLVPATWWLLFRSRWGLLIRGAGERTEVLRTYGHNPVRVQYIAVVLGGLLAGIGGAQLSTAYANAWFENMVQGRGFIAVAVVIFAARQPFKVMAGSYSVRRRARAVPSAAGARREHQPVRAERDPVRRDHRRADAARPPWRGGGAGGPEEGLRDGTPCLTTVRRPAVLSPNPPPRQTTRSEQCANAG